MSTRHYTWEYGFNILVLFKTKNTSNDFETKKCLLHPKHASNTIDGTVEITISQSKKISYNGYLYTETPFVKRTSPRYATGVYCSIVCGSKTAHGFTGGMGGKIINLSFSIFHQSMNRYFCESTLFSGGLSDGTGAESILIKYTY